MLFFVVVAMTIAACGQNAATVYNSRIYHDRWQDFFSSNDGQEYLAVIWGTPFEGRKGETETVVLDAVAVAFNRPGYRFLTNPSSLDPLAPRLAIMLNPANAPQGAPCGDFATATPVTRPIASGGDIEIHAALCRGITPLTRAQGRAGGLTGPDDARFRDLVYQVANKVFQSPPGSNPRSGDGTDPS